MSYDLQIGIPDLLPPSVVQEWAARRGLRVEGQNSIYDAEGWLFDLGHPLPMEPEEFAEEYEAARLGLRWQLGITSSFAREHVELALSVAQAVAEATGGAAFDYQAGCLLWPEGAMHPEDLMEGPHPTVRRLNLMWAVPARHWAHAGGRGPAAPGAFTPEYGTWHGPPFFGGRWAPPAPDVGVIELDMDADAIAPEDAVELFATLARDLKAFFAAAQVEPGWTVRDGRLHGIAEEWHQRRQPVLRGRTWRGLPPVPVWLS